MSIQNFRDYNLELELSIPEAIHCTKREVWFPIARIDFPTFEVASDYVGLFPNIHHGRDLSKGVEEDYEPKPYDYYSVPRVIKNGNYKIHCSMFIKTDSDREIKQCLKTWLLNTCEDFYVPSVIKGYSKDNGTLASEKIKCTKTFIWNLNEDSMCGEKYIDFTFICDDMIEETI
jgi:hypothetical protein